MSSSSLDAPKTSHIWPEEIRLVDGEWVVAAVLERADGKDKHLEFRVPEELGDSISDRQDHFLLASVFYSMRAGDTCDLQGHASEILLVNLTEFSAIWHAW